LREPAAEVAPGLSTTTLGDWYADILFTARQHVVLCVSEHARVPVIIPARDLKTLASRLPDALAQVLTDLTIPSASIARELGEMKDVQFAKTASRSLLGTINDYAIAVTWALAEEPGISLHRLSVRLTDTPVGPMKYDRPADVVRRLLG
jgi:hypothetical protein